MLTEENGNKIITIKVNPSNVPISFHGRYYIRTGSVVLELQGEKLSDFLLQKTNNSWDNCSHVESKIDDIDIETIELFRRLSVDRLPSIFDERNT